MAKMHKECKFPMKFSSIGGCFDSLSAFERMSWFTRMAMRAIIAKQVCAQHSRQRPLFEIGQARLQNARTGLREKE
jgi:hypothetical protein